MTRVGITGASGFLGRALAGYFVAPDDDIDVVALTRTLPLDAHADLPGVEWREGDLASPYDAAMFVDRLDCVVHLAHKGTPLTSGNDLPGDAISNLVPLLTLLQAIRERGGACHIVYASSGGALYGTARPGQPASETSPLTLTSSYAIQKLAGEEYLRLAAAEGWLTAAILRIGNAYGTLLPPDRSQGFLGVAVSRIASGEPLRLIGDTRNVRDYVHVTDVCSAFAAVIRPRSGFDIFNIGTGVGTSIDELLELLAEITERKLTIERVVGAERLPLWVVLDASKARGVLGWEPRISLREGIERLWRSATG